MLHNKEFPVPEYADTALRDSTDFDLIQTGNDLDEIILHTEPVFVKTQPYFLVQRDLSTSRLKERNEGKLKDVRCVPLLQPQFCFQIAIRWREWH